MSYHAPVNDILFVMKELAGLADILALPGFDDISEDLIELVLRENARFVEQELAPLNHSADQSPAVWDNGTVTTSPGFKDAFRKYAEGEWQGLQHGRKWGGQGLPKLVGAAVSENMNAANLAFSLCPLLTDGVLEALTIAGDGEQQSLYIKPLLQGRWTGTMNLTEPQAGSDLALISSKAVRQANGSYRLSGQKIFITYGEHDLAENIIHLVLARTPGAPAGVKGISLFIVPKFLVDDDGSLGQRNDVWCASIEHKLGIHGSPTAVLVYGSGKGETGDAAVGYLIGHENQGLDYMFIMMNAARYAVGIQGVALCDRALQQAQAYACQRIQGQALEGSAGPVAIVQHPDVQRMLLTMRALTEGARALAYVAAAANDASRHHADPQTQAEHKALYEYLVPIVKGHATESSVEVASLGIQVHGGAGFIEETGAAQYYRDARILPIYEGTTAIQANDLLGRKTLRDGGKVARILAGRMRATLSELNTMAMSDEGHGAGLELIALHFDRAVTTYETALDYVLENAKDTPLAVFFGSVPYLMLCGTVLGGWQMARAAMACSRCIAAGSRDAFYDKKLATCVFYAACILPRAESLCTSLLHGQVVSQYAQRALTE